MTCPICKLDDGSVNHRPKEDRDCYDCPRCGRFDISGSAAAIAGAAPADTKLSAWLRSQQGSSPVPLVTSTTLQTLTKGLPDYRVGEKQILFLRALEARTEFAGQKVHIVTEYDFTLAWCKTGQELEYIIRALMGRALVQLDKWGDPKDSFSLELAITPSGWSFLDETGRPAILSNQAFVAMSFSDELRPAWIGGIEPAVRKAGYQPFRTDAAPHIDRIDAKIVSEIRNSRFVIADVTQQRAGVYFEAGFAIGLGLPVFWSVREDDKDNVHFDTRQYNHIVWTTESDLAEKLYFFITSIVGRNAAG